MYAEILSATLGLRRRFKVRMACGSRLSHSLIGNELSTPERMAMKLFVKVWMARQHCCVSEHQEGQMVVLSVQGASLLRTRQSM